MADVLSATGLDPDAEVEFTVAFFGDRTFKIEEIALIPPYVADLIERFERRIVSQSPSSRPTR